MATSAGIFATGEYILTHHAVPHHDLYSFSKPDAPWYAWEWLTDVIDGSLHRDCRIKRDRADGRGGDRGVRDHLIRRMVWRGVHCLSR